MNDLHNNIEEFEIDISFDAIDDKNVIELQELKFDDEWDDDDDDDSRDEDEDGDEGDDEGDGDLDISWINSYEKELNIDQNIMREPVNEITIKTVYIKNKNNNEKNKGSEYEIIKASDSVVKTCMINNKHGLTKEFLLYHIQSRKILDDGSKYKLDSIVTYIISIEPEEIQAYIQNAGYVELSTNSFMKKYSVVEDLLFSDSIFVFHPINCVYLFLIENSGGVGGGGCAGGVGYIKSILKNKTRKAHKVGGDGDGDGGGDESGGEKHKSNITKKVYFFDEAPEPIAPPSLPAPKNTTRKNTGNGGNIVVRKNITRKSLPSE